MAKSEKHEKKAERKRRKGKEKRPYARPELTSYGVVERFTGGQLS